MASPVGTPFSPLMPGPDLALRSSMLENSTRLDSTRFESNKNFMFEKSSRTRNRCSMYRVEQGVMLDRKFRVRVEQIGLLDRCSTRSARNARKINCIITHSNVRLPYIAYCEPNSVFRYGSHTSFDDHLSTSIMWRQISARSRKPPSSL